MATIHGKAPALVQRQSKVFTPSPRSLVVMRSTGWADPSSTRAENAMFGQDFGARDPTAAELESNFSDKVLGNWNTDHIIKIPTAFKNFVGLTAARCVPADQLSQLEEKEYNLLKQQIPGWKIVKNKAGQTAVRCDWRVKNVEAAQQLQAMVQKVGADQGHPADVTVSGDIVVAELSTSQVGGLSFNDFIVAAQVNELNIKDLMPPPRKRYWA